MCTFKELGFLLNGQFYQPGSSIDYSNIGEGLDALRCVTPFFVCCIRILNADILNLVDWIFPNGETVVEASGESIYWTREQGSLVLHRDNNVPMPTGLYTCKIRNKAGQIDQIQIDVKEPGIVQ